MRREKQERERESANGVFRFGRNTEKEEPQPHSGEVDTTKHKQKQTPPKNTKNLPFLRR
jgi:hypothetical protein